MNTIRYLDDQLCVEQVPVAQIVEAVGSPVYIYSRAQIEDGWRRFDEAFAGRNHLVCFAVKANPNLGVLNALARLGSGFDIVSVGELERVLAAGGDPARIVFSGVGKTPEEMRRALEVGILSFNVESSSELQMLNQVAATSGRQAPVSIRVNPDVDPNTHPYISTGLKENKFGIPVEDAIALYLAARDLPFIDIQGIDCHIGSQLTEIDPFLEALDRVLELVGELADLGIELNHVDLGGGLGISYYDEQPPEPDELVMALNERLQTLGSQYQRMKFIVEPGRSIVGNAGMLVTRVQYLKKGQPKNFAIVDAAMNDLMRPALYDAWQEIVPVHRNSGSEAAIYDVVGPICESGDFLGRDRELEIAEQDLLAVLSAGAYGASMSSNYNSRPRAAEVMVDGNQFHVVRDRETIAHLFQGEHLLPDN